MYCAYYPAGLDYPSPRQSHPSKQMPEAVPLEIYPAFMENSLNLLRHLNPNETEKNLKLLGEALPEIKDSLKEIVDVPSKFLIDT